MRTIKTTFTKRGFIHNQIMRDGNIALFSRRKRLFPEHFEVVVISSHNGYEVSGVKIEASEVYPSSSTWGTYGWTFHDREDASEKFHKLVSDRDSK